MRASLVCGDLSFTTGIPGGYRTLDCSLLRGLLDDRSDLSLLDNVRAYGPGNRTAWDGRWAQLPRNDSSVSPGAVGHSASMKDFPGFTEIYVDRDMSSWGDAPLALRRAAANAGVPQGKIPVTLQPSGVGGVSWAPPNEALPDEERTEIFYDAGPGLKVGYLNYKGTRIGAFTGFESPTVFVGDAEDFSGTTASAALTLNDAVNTATLSPALRYAVLRCRVSAGAVTPAAGHLQSFTKLAVHGAHGLSARAVAGDTDGYYGDDLIAHVVGSATQLTVARGAGGIETNASFVIPHAVFRDPVTAEEAVMKLNSYFLWEWGVYDDRVFFWRQPDPDRLTWTARRAKGARVTDEGEAADQLFNGVLVYYTDPEGRRRVAGPPAGSWPGMTAKADVASSALVDSSSSNPVNAHGIPQKWGKIDIGFPTTDAGATQLGAVWLAEHSLPQHRGTITLTGSAEHPQERDVPAWRVRAGDWIKVGDLPGDQPRRIIETRYSHSQRQLVASVGNTDYKVGAILERIGVQFLGVL